MKIKSVCVIRIGADHYYIIIHYYYCYYNFFMAAVFAYTVCTPFII